MYPTIWNTDLHFYASLNFCYFSVPLFVTVMILCKPLHMGKIVSVAPSIFLLLLTLCYFSVPKSVTVMKLCKHIHMDRASWVRYPVWQHTFVSPSAFSRRAVVSYWRKYVHEILVNRLGGLSLPRKSVVRLTDRPDMTLDVYRGRKTTIQQQYNIWTGPFQ